MVEVTDVIGSRIDFLLGNLVNFWQDVPHVTLEIDDWDVAIREDYLVDDCYFALHPLFDELKSRQSEFDSEQERRYQELLALIEKNQPVLEAIFEL